MTSGIVHAYGFHLRRHGKYGGKQTESIKEKEKPLLKKRKTMLKFIFTANDNLKKSGIIIRNRKISPHPRRIRAMLTTLLSRNR